MTQMPSWLKYTIDLRPPGIFLVEDHHLIQLGKAHEVYCNLYPLPTRAWQSLYPCHVQR